MKNTFTLFDIPNLMKSFGNASIANDCLAPFLNSYDFENVYETEDNSLVFDAGGENEISIMYKENGKYVILYHEDLMGIA